MGKLLLGTACAMFQTKGQPCMFCVALSGTVVFKKLRHKLHSFQLPSCMQYTQSDNYVMRLRLWNKTGTKDLSTIYILFKVHPFCIDTASGTILQRLEGPLHVFLWYGPKTRCHSCLDVLNFFKQAPFQW